MLTGADEFVLGDDDGGSSGDGGSANASGPTGGPTGGPTSGSGGMATSSTGATPPPEGDATGVAITKVAFYQGVESTVFENGSIPAFPSVSIVAGRPAVVRVFTQPGQLSGAPITARLFVGSTPIEQTVSSIANSSQNQIGSTVNFDVPGELLQPGTTWRVELKEGSSTSTGPNASASTPTGDLRVTSSGTLKVTLVPIQYQADGSNRLPDTSANQVQGYRELFLALYPTAQVDITVHDPVGWSQTVSASGNGWDNLLNAISQLRQQEAVGFDEFYYGIFEPAGSFNTFCGGGCVAGLGFVGDPNGEYSRAAIGLGYPGGSAHETAVHEIGHTHGRPHSPCGGVSGADPGYPHSGGSIGVWGMYTPTKELLSPQYKDMMGYCSPLWISDYVYEEILDFSKAISNAQIIVPPEALDRTYERISFGPDGARFLDSMPMHRPPMGPQEDVWLTDADGNETLARGTVYRYDHLDGGVLVVPSPDVATTVRRARLRAVLGGAARDVIAER